MFTVYWRHRWFRRWRRQWHQWWRLGRRLWHLCRPWSCHLRDHCRPNGKAHRLDTNRLRRERRRNAWCLPLLSIILCHPHVRQRTRPLSPVRRVRPRRRRVPEAVAPAPAPARTPVRTVAMIPRTRRICRRSRRLRGSRRRRRCRRSGRISSRSRYQPWRSVAGTSALSSTKLQCNPENRTLTPSRFRWDLC